MATHSLLVATDFSSCSREAIDYATGLAAGLGASVVIGYVADPNVFNSAYLAEKIGAGFLSMTAEQVKAAAAEVIAAELTTIVHAVKKSGVSCKSVVLEGQPAQALTDYANENNCTMMVVGTRGHSNLEHFMYGSTTDRLLRTAGCPVLVVREKAENTAKSKAKS